MIGSVVGNYKIIDKIGEGGMGSVFKGVDLMLEREVAIKMLRTELARQPNIVERFRTEAVTLAKLNHTNVATLHSFFRQGDDFFMVMEFVRGETLDHIIRGRGAMPCDKAVELFCQALEGIDHAHKMGIVHRDIKPANMMLTEGGSIKVMDFGIARVLGTDRLTRAGHLIGTVEYMSPEQVRGEETDARSDIYSLGILLYEMLTGRVPFNSNSEYDLMRSQIEEAPTPPRALAPHIPLTIEQAIMRALAKKREARFQSASDMRATLLQKTAGLVTMPLQVPESSETSFAPTQILEAPAVAPASVGVMKETRLGGDQRNVPASTGGQLKETRLSQPAVAAAYATTAPGHYGSQPAVAAPAAQASFLNKLNWKHFAGAGAALVVVVVAIFALAGRGANPQPSTIAQPETTSSSAPPATQAQQPSAPQQQPIVTPTNPLDSRASSAAGRSRDNRNEKGTAATPTTETPALPQSSETQPATKRDKVASEKPADKKSEAAKEPEKKVEEKKRGLFGRIKDAIVGDKKKDDKKKDEQKKP